MAPLKPALGVAEVRGGHPGQGWRKNLSPEQMRVNVQVRHETQGGYHVDTLDLYQAKARAVFLRQASAELGQPEDALKRDLGALLLKLEMLQDEALRASQAPKSTAPVLTAIEEREALALLRSPDLAARIVADLQACGVVGEATNLLAGYLAATSRKLAAPLAVLIQSSSAAGKSSLMDAVLTMMPPEERIQYSAMTGQSLFYLGETQLQHKVLAIAEEEGVRQAAYALKLLQSDGELTIASTGKDEATGNLVTKQYRVQGPVMLMLTTTAIDIDEELLNRCMVLTVNRRLAALARERFNFSDGRDARDIRLSFGYQSRVSRELSDLGAATSLSYGGSSGSVGEIRAMSATEGFFTFNPVGRFMKGWGHSATEILKSPYTLGREAVFMVGDVVGNGTYAAMNWAFGGNQSYQNDSALGRSLETNGVLGTIGLATKGAVLSLPGIAQIDAINRRDWSALGESGPTSLLAVSGELALSRGASNTRGIGGLGSPLRGERDRVLTASEIAFVTDQWTSLGGNPSVLRFNEGRFTGASDRGVVYIRGDVFPTASESLHPTATLTVRETLAHEMGHMQYIDTGVKPGAWNDEFRASYWASRNVPGLTQAEQFNLVRDALQRAQDAGVSVNKNSYIRSVLYGY